jgi:hypothetical protein
MKKFQPAHVQNCPSRLRLALQHTRSVGEFVFHLGYQQFYPPRFLRRMFARSTLHRAWLSGYTGAGILTVLEREAEWS